MNELSQQADRFSNVIGVAAPASSPRQPKDDALTRRGFWTFDTHFLRNGAVTWSSE